MTVSPELANIRPIILGAVVKGLDIDDDIIKRLMDHQEKLHFALGREEREHLSECMIWRQFHHHLGWKR